VDYLVETELHTLPPLKSPTSTTKDIVGSGCLSNEAEVIRPFSRLKASPAAGLHTNPWGPPFRREVRGVALELKFLMTWR
jgi:hypothetical protein